jgi:hypothetical protein
MDAMAYNLGFVLLWWSGTGGLTPLTPGVLPFTSIGDQSSRGVSRGGKGDSMGTSPYGCGIGGHKGSERRRSGWFLAGGLDDDDSFSKQALQRRRRARESNGTGYCCVLIIRGVGGWLSCPG